MSKTIPLKKKNAPLSAALAAEVANIDGAVTSTNDTPPWTHNADTPEAATEVVAAAVGDTPALPTGLEGVALETTDHVEQGSFKAAIKGATKQAGAIMVKRDQLHIAPGFNVRAHSPDYMARVEAIGRSMFAEGWFPSKPVEVFVDAEGRLVPTDGHTRLLGHDHALSLGAQIDEIPVVVTTNRTMEDMTVGLVKQNEGRPLLPIEKAVVCRRLSKWGWDAKKIGDRLDMTPRYVDELLGLLAAPAALVALVQDGTVSASTAMQAIKDVGAAQAAAEIVPVAAKVRAAGGTKKVTGATLKKANAQVKAPAAAPKAPTKKVNPADMKHDPMDVLRAVFNDPGFNKLADAVQVMVLAIAA